MTIEQTVEIPASRRIFLDLPFELPVGKAKITITSPTEKPIAIEDVRLLLQQEMAEKGTSGVMAATGDGWEAHVREYYAES
jgi:hypothetical protein